MRAPARLECSAMPRTSTLTTHRPRNGSRSGARTIALGAAVLTLCTGAAWPAPTLEPAEPGSSETPPAAEAPPAPSPQAERPAPKPRPGVVPADDADVLAGPEVERSSAPIAPEGFGGMPAQEGAKAERVPQRVLMRAVRALETHDDDALRLTPAQQRDIRALHRAFQQEQRAFRAEHADEIAELRRLGAERMQRPARRPAGAQPDRAPTQDQDTAPKGSTPTPGDTDASRGAATKALRDLMSKAPAPEATQRAIWAVLTEPQQAELTAAIDAWRAARRAAADEARMERYREQARDRFEQMGEAANVPGGFDRLPARARERIEAMPEAEWIELARRLSAMSPQERRAEIRRLMRERD